MGYVYDFDEPCDSGRELLGGKGVGLAEMTQLGVPVPAGFTITTEACRDYMRAPGRLPDGLAEEVEQHIQTLEAKVGKRFGDRHDPLLVSVRSGAAISMPGMMDTILNVGLGRESVEGLAERSGNRRFAYDSYRRLIQMYGETVDGIDGHRFEQELSRLKQERGAEQDVDLRSGRSRRTRASSSPAPSRLSSSRGTRRAQRSTGAPTRSRTTSAPRSTSCRWSSATRARPPEPG
jgi:pyruvate,orthophosphate dikinase